MTLPVHERKSIKGVSTGLAGRRAMLERGTGGNSGCWCL